MITECNTSKTVPKLQVMPGQTHEIFLITLKPLLSNNKGFKAYYKLPVET
jgi:hypothetical protein